MVVAAYIRVSTDEQADKGNSLKEQQERLSAYCIAMGWSKPEFYIDDGYSAKDLKRPAIQRLIKDVEKNKIQIVITSKLDRFCRNLLDLLQTINILAENNCTYVSASESFDTSTAVGRMTLQLLGTFAEFERERISERVKDNMSSIARNTDKAITRPCYGFDIIDGKYTINDEEAEGVRFMFDLAEEGHGHRMIAKRLNEKLIHTKKGKTWDQTNVKRLMRNKTLAGTIVYNKRQTKGSKITLRDEKDWIIKENNHDAIIDPERFDKIQELFSTRSVAGKHADSESYLLTSLVKCKHCGKGMKGATSRNKNKYGEYTYYRYICSSYVAGYGCKHHAVHRDDLEKIVLQVIEDLANTSTKEIDIKIAPRPEVLEEIKYVNDELSKIEHRYQKQIEAYENDLISPDDLKKARVRIEAVRKEFKQRLSLLKSKTREAAEVKEKAIKLLPVLRGDDRIKAKQAIRQLIDSIEVENQEMIDFTWK